MGESGLGRVPYQALGARRGRSLPRRLALLVVSWVGLCAGVAAPALADRAERTRPGPPGASPPWAQVDRLITGQRLTEAVRTLQSLHKAALAAERADDATRAAIRLAQVRTTLSHYELAVAVLHEQLQWQQSRRPAAGAAAGADAARATLAMFYAQALVQYAQMYSFQVGQRERAAAPVGVEPSFPTALRTWTREQLLEEAERALAPAWELRAALGGVPVSALPEYVEPGTRPRDEAPTLRDLLTYQYVELLSHPPVAGSRASRDPGPWTPAPTAAELLGPAGVLSSGEPLRSERLHPLAKVAAALGDLASWHQAAGRSAAALAAQVERLERLHAALPDPAQRAEVRERLAALLPGASALPAGTRAHAVLAELLRQQASEHPDAAAPDQLTRAYAIAAQGARRFPDSPGGKRCRLLMQSLTAPEFHLTSQAVDGPGRRSLLVRHRNMPVLHFRAYLYDPVQRLLTGGSDNIHPSGREIEALLRGGRPAAVWSAALPATPDLKAQETPLAPPLTAPGAYVIVGSARADFARAGNRLEAVHLAISDLILWTTAAARGTHVTAVSGRTGEPLAGVELTLYATAAPAPPPEPGSRPVMLLHRVRTGPDGGAELPRPEAAGRVLVGHLGEHAALMEVEAPAEPDEPAVQSRAVLALDRGVYRPQQKVRWKLVAYERPGGPGAVAVAANQRLAVTLLDASFQQVARVQVTTGRLGTAAGEFTLPVGRPLGPWHIEAWRGPARSGEAVLHVAEDPAPPSLRVTPMQVELRSEREFFRSQEPATLQLLRRDLRGRPCPGSASWRLLRLPASPRPADPTAEDRLVADQRNGRPAPRPRPDASALAPLRDRPDGAEHLRGELTHAPDGLAELRLPALPPGAYRLRYQSRDALGRGYQTARELLVVADPGEADAELGLPAVLLRERATAQAAEPARFAVGSGLSGQALFIEIHRPDGSVQRQLRRGGREPLLLELPVQPTEEGPLVVTLTAVRAHRLLHLEQRVDVKRADQALQLEFSAFNDRLRPGARQTLRIKVKTAAGAAPAPGSTELLAYMYDRRLDALAPPTSLLDAERLGPAPAPVGELFTSVEDDAAGWQYADPPADDPARAAPRPDRLRLRLNFFLARPGRASDAALGRAVPTWQRQPQAPSPTVRSAGSAHADPAAAPRQGSALADGGDGESAAPSPSPFADTAFFLPHLLLQPDGTATIEFTVPAALTEWNVRVEALTAELRGGAVTRTAQSVDANDRSLPAPFHAPPASGPPLPAPEPAGRLGAAARTLAPAAPPD